MAFAAEPLDTFQSFTTPEHIAFRHRVAGPMARALAYLLDWVARGVLLLLLLFVSSFFAKVFGDGFAVGVWLLAFFVLDWLYGGLFEWLWKGATPGKRALGIRVVGTDGLPAGPGACFLRNFMRGADALPFATLILGLPIGMFAVGLLAMITFRGFQRLGDLAAGTLVVYDEHGSRERQIRFSDQRLEQTAEGLPGDLLDRVDARTMRAISQYVSRRSRVGPGRRNEMAAYLADPLREVLGLGDEIKPDTLLCAVYLRAFQGEDERGAGRAAGVIRARSPEWKTLERDIEQPPSNAAEAFAFSHRYRSACADLAIAEAYHLPPGQVSYLHDLVARAHHAFYRRLVLPMHRIRSIILEEVPAALYGDACLRMALLAFFGVFGASALLAYADPHLAVAFLGEDQVANLQEMYASAPRDRELDEAGGMGGFYVWNNVGIALRCFVGGIFLGIGSLVYLVYNGLALGLSFGFMATVGAATKAHFFEFVTAHGPFELTGIALSGAAGFRLGLGLVARGGRPWREALVASAARSLRIALVAALMVAAAAPIEAFVSPSSLPLWSKRLVGLTCLTVVLMYLLGLGWRGHRMGRHLDGEAA